jgi:hypothetical protein
MTTIKITKLALIAAATVATTIALPATANAEDDIDFQSPSRNIACTMMLVPANNYVQCDMADHTFPTPGTCRKPGPTGVTTSMRADATAPPVVGCDLYANLLPSSWPVLDYGQTRTLGVITCDSEPAGITCTNSSNGHFFRLSRDSYDVG